ncbi:MAG: polyphosphate kinase 2 family protein [Candidatus Melainabacteria bacterium]|nr:polyphosphate kinase 2 family protein [Candidatus Melainabacteria bacterium]
MADKLNRDLIRSFIDPYRVTDGKNFKLSRMDPDDTASLTAERKAEAKELLARGINWLADKQDVLYAHDRWSVLLIFQAMDAAGKDSTIKHVMSGVNPQGCQVFSFKEPSAEELDHDFLWRYLQCLPERGRIGIFNRSYYEEVLVVRVHEEILEKQKLPDECMSKHIWKDRLEDIKNIERYLTRNGTLVLKFFLNVSKDEQKRRFLKRLDLPEKHWKFAMSDIKERQYWNNYMKAYEDAIKATATDYAPWFVVPADNKWFMRLVVAAAVVEALDKIKLSYPDVGKAKLKEISSVRAALEKS